jgi:3'(2'),5'-bisphosphate nucleotidase
MLEKIIGIAQKGADLTMKYHGLNPEVKLKSDQSPVTIADIEADNYLRDAIQTAFPKDKILSEETENTITDFSGRVWIIDPLDGTRTYTLGKKEFSNIIGLCIDGVPVLGVVCAPALGLTYFAEKGKGAYVSNGQSISRINVNNISDITIASGVIKPGKTTLANIPISQSTFDSGAAIKIMEIAKGNYDLHIDASYKASKWDTCGAQIILEEAGGKLTDLAGKPIDYMTADSRLQNSFVASNGYLHTSIIEEVKKYP